MSWFDGGGAGQEIDVVAFLDSGVPQVMGEVVAAGALVSIGRTSDGGAVAITVTYDGAYRREYFRDTDEATSFLIAARDAVAEEASKRPASHGRQKRSRRP